MKTGAAKVEYADLKIEDIKGAMTFDPLKDFGGKSGDLEKALRSLCADLRTKYPMLGPIVIETGPVLDEEALKALVMNSPEAAKIAAQLATRRSSGPESIRINSDRPRFRFAVDAEKAHFLFDQVEDIDCTRSVLEGYLKCITATLSLLNIRQLGMKFTHIFRLRPGFKNYTVLNDTLLRGITGSGQPYGSFGVDRDYRRADISWVFYRNKGEFITEVQFEAPGNEENETLWLMVDAQTTGGFAEIRLVRQAHGN